MKKKKELFRDIQKVIDLVRSCILLQSDLILLRLPEYEDFYLRYPFFDRALRAYNATLINELYILFSTKENYSLSNILNRSLNNFSSLDWEVPIDKNTIKNFLLQLDELINSETNNKVKEARDKYYSHLDKNGPSLITICPEEITKMVNFGKNVTSTLFTHLGNGFVCFDSRNLDGKNLFNDLERFAKVQIKEFGDTDKKS